MSTEKFHCDLDRRALADLIGRGRIGCYFYAPIWLVIAVVNDLEYTHQSLLYYNLAIFLVTGTARESLGHLHADFTHRNYRAITRAQELPHSLSTESSA